MTNDRLRSVEDLYYRLTTFLGTVGASRPDDHPWVVEARELADAASVLRPDADAMCVVTWSDGEACGLCSMDLYERDAAEARAERERADQPDLTIVVLPVGRDRAIAPDDPTP